jgi:hypothetical protein
MFRFKGTIFRRYKYPDLLRRDSGSRVDFVNKLDLICEINRLILKYKWSVYIDVVFSFKFCGKCTKEYFFFFILSNLLILTVLVELTVGR